MSFKIVIASTRFVVGEGFKSIMSNITTHVDVISESQDKLERGLITIQPDLVIIDDFDKIFKAEKTIAFLSFARPAQVVILCDSINVERYDLFAKVGVRQFVSSFLKADEVALFIKSIEEKSFFRDRFIESRLNYNPEEIFKATCAELNISEREVEIIKLIAEGFINKEIADQLFLSTHTVNTHRKNIMAKLGVSNATGIVIFAVKEKLISPKNFLFSSKR